MADFLGIHWAGIDRIMLIPGLLLLLWLIIRNFNRVRSVVRILARPEQRAKVFQNFSVPRYFFKTVFLCIGLIFLFLALLQPQWGKKEHQVVQEGRDLLVLFDISRSMQAKDITPSRIEFAKLKVRNLLSKLSFERVGLVIFSGTAFVQCPLTVDHAAFLMFLNDLDVETIASGTTSIDTALVKAIDVFKGAQGRKNKLVLLVTDGEDFSMNLESAQYKALKENMTVFTLGVGTTEGAPVPRFDATGNMVGHETDDSGNIAITKLNEQLLQSISEKLTGKYFKATYSDADINQIASIVKGYEKEKISDKNISMYEDQYPWLLGFSWIMFALEWIL
jgi:Ca-activated chloride channel homolog